MYKTLKFLFRYNMYDSYTSDIGEAKLMTSYLHDVIKQEIDQGIEASNIIIGGFSQGGALALYSSLTSPWQLGGTIILSSFLLAAWEFTAPRDKPLVNTRCPILLCHGLADEKVMKT